VKRCEVELVAASRQKAILESQLKTLQTEVYAAREKESARKADIEELKAVVTSLEDGSMSFHKNSPHDMNLESHGQERTVLPKERKEDTPTSPNSVAIELRIVALEREKAALQRQISEADDIIGTLRSEKEKALSQVTILESKLTRLSHTGLSPGKGISDLDPAESIVLAKREVEFQSQIKALEDSYGKEIKLLEARLTETHNAMREAQAPKPSEPGYMHDSTMGVLKNILPPGLRAKAPKFQGEAKAIGSEEGKLALTMGNAVEPYNSTMGLIAHISPLESAAANMDLSTHSSTDYTD